MLTAEEIADRKKARKLLEQKRIVLEEAVERRACEGIYDRIWRHRSTQDEAKDEKLRSKTAALSVVGIGLTELGIDLGQNDPEKPTGAQEKEEEVREWLNEAREELTLMNDQKYPLGKLQHLKAAHKSIVDTLSHFHPSSSADEIMPMLIYTLITSPPENLNVISNLYFIQRFRCESKIDGEAAYCLTNLEAAITFLETVDLTSLRADETPSGPPKSMSSRPTTPGIEQKDPLSKRPSVLTASALSPAVVSPLSSTVSTPTKASSTPFSSLRPVNQSQNRRLSDIFQPPAQAINNASEAVLSTADQSFKNIGNSLGDSYKFLLGKLKERQESIPQGEVLVPKTLDDARKLVGTPPPEDDGSVSGSDSIHEKPEGSTPRPDDKMLNLIGGRKASNPVRDHSADSLRSSSSGKKVAFSNESEDKEKATPSPLGVAGSNQVVDTMRNLGQSLNPMNRIAGMGMMSMRGFGRSTPPVSSGNDRSKELGRSVPDGGVLDMSSVSHSGSSSSRSFVYISI
jgi:hypothetical protein